MLTGVRRDVIASATSDAPLEQLSRIDKLVGGADSPYVTPAARMGGVTRGTSWDWPGFAWAAGTVALATGVGWPLVHSPLHLVNANVLMLYLVCVIWVATHHTRAAAVLTSVLAVAAFDFVFVEPFYRFTVADQQYVLFCRDQYRSAVAPVG